MPRYFLSCHGARERTRIQHAYQRQEDNRRRYYNDIHTQACSIVMTLSSARTLSLAISFALALSLACARDVNVPFALYARANCDVGGIYNARVNHDEAIAALTAILGHLRVLTDVSNRLAVN